ncbi:MAG: lipopolysaccharide biosynthesis protein [Candidatus Eisenbacteria bacterium]|nr:lipopolysaccharide biosynthesis protein [Candidatus Eisenbacteria bacterium]
MSNSGTARPRPEPEGAAGAATPPALDRQIARNSILNLLGRFVYVLGWTLVAPFMLHHLGPERFGLWSLLTVVSGIYLAFDFGLSSALTKFVAEFRASGDRVALRGVFTTGAILYGVLSLLFVAAIALLRGPLLDLFRIPPALRPEASAALVMAAVVYGLLNAYMLMSSVLSGLHRIDLWNRISMVVTLVQLFGVWAVLSLGGGLTALLLNTGVTLLLGTLLGHLTVRRLAPEIGLEVARIELELVHRLTRYSAALQIVNLGVLFQFQLDKVLFGSMLSLTAVGSYEFGFRVTSALWAVPALLLPPLLPAVAHLDAKGDRARIVRLYRRASRYVLAVAFPISAAVIALAPVLFLAWLGPGHRDAALAATALAAMLGVNILTGVGTAVARGVGRPGLEVRYQVLAMALHLALSLSLIPRFGFAGGLWALFLSTSVGSLYFLWLFHRYLGEPVGRFALEVLARPLLAAAVAGALAWWVAGSGDPGLESWTRSAALVRLGTAGSLFLAVVAVLMLASGFLSLAELRDLGGLVTGRRPVASGLARG